MITMYLDSVNGSDLNDGLTPLTAIATLDAVVLADVKFTDHVALWIRNGSDIIIAANTVCENIDLIGWPAADDPGFDEKPSDAWDADVVSTPTVSYTVDNARLTLYGVINKHKIYNIIIRANGSTTGSYLDMSFGHYYFKNVFVDNITYHFIRVSSSRGVTFETGLELNFDGVSISSGYDLVTSDASNNNFNVATDIHIDNSDIICSYLLCANSSYLCANKKTVIKNSNITTSKKVIGTKNYFVGAHNYHDILFDNCVFVCGEALIGRIDGTENSMGYLHYSPVIKNCTITTTGYIVDMYGYSRYTYGYHYIDGLEVIDNAVISAKGILTSHCGYAATISALYISGTVSILRNIGVISENYMYFTGSYIYLNASVNIVDNELANATGLVYSNTTYNTQSLIPNFVTVLKNQVLTLPICNVNVTTANVIIENSDVADIGTYNNGTLSIVNSVTGKFSGPNLQASGISSTISGAPAIDNVRSVDLSNCIIENSGDALCLNGGKLVAIGCDVTNNMDTFVTDSATFVNSTVNGIDTTYIAITDSTIRDISSVRRTGGSDETLHIVGNASQQISFNVANISGVVGSAITEISCYIAGSVNEDATLPAITGFLYGFSGGVKTGVELSYIEDALSVWQGIDVTVQRRKLIADVSSANLDEGSVFNFDISFNIAIEDSKEFFIDLIPVQV